MKPSVIGIAIVLVVGALLLLGFGMIVAMMVVGAETVVTWVRRVVRWIMRVCE